MSEDRQPEPPRRSTERYPGNSHSEREAAKNKTVEPVRKGSVTLRKPMGTRIRESLTGDDAHSIGSYLLFDVVIPAIKDLVVETGKEALERAFFPTGGGPRSRNRPYNSGSGGQFSRLPYSSRGSRRDDPPFEREESRRSRRRHKIDEIILETRGDAEVTLEKMRNHADEFGQISVAEVLDELGAGSDDNWVLRDWGWTPSTLKNAEVRRLRSDEYLLDLPEPERFAS